MKSYFLIAALAATSLVISAHPASAGQILLNGGFESGSLSPWFQSRDFSGHAGTGNWAVTSSDFHSGAFSATDSGNKELRQNFAPIPVSSVTSVSFWMKHPAGAGTPMAFDFFYTDGSDQEFYVSSTDANWDFFNVTSDLAAGKVLDGFSVFGVSGANPETTFLDDVSITALPEPTSLAVFGLVGIAGAGIAAWRRRKAIAA